MAGLTVKVGAVVYGKARWQASRGRPLYDTMFIDQCGVQQGAIVSTALKRARRRAFSAARARHLPVVLRIKEWK